MPWASVMAGVWRQADNFQVPQAELLYRSASRCLYVTDAMTHRTTVSLGTKTPRPAPVPAGQDTQYTLRKLTEGV